MTDKNSFIQTNGQGVWYVLHLLALHAKNDHAKRSYTLTINTLAEHFACDKCRVHFKKFITNHPLKNYWDINYGKYINIGFFKWTWELHNEINLILDKKLVTLDDALIFYVHNICTHCAEDEPRKFVNKILIPIEENNDNIISTLVSRK